MVETGREKGGGGLGPLHTLLASSSQPCQDANNLKVRGPTPQRTYPEPGPALSIDTH